MTLTLRSISEEVPQSPTLDLEKQLAQAAAFVRRHAIASIYHAGSGHPGGAMSCADILACLFGAELNFWPSAIDDPHRDPLCPKGGSRWKSTSTTTTSIDASWQSSCSSCWR